MDETTNDLMAQVNQQMRESMEASRRQRDRDLDEIQAKFEVLFQTMNLSPAELMRNFVSNLHSLCGVYIQPEEVDKVVDTIIYG